jgi:hypothetical protein
MQPSSAHDAVRRILTTAGVGTATAVLTIAAAVPAFACQKDGHGSNPGDRSDRSTAQAHSDQAKTDQAQTDQAETDQAKTGAGSSGEEHSGAGSAHATSTHHSAKGGEESKGGDHATGKPTKTEGESRHGARTEGHNPPGNNGTVFIHDVAGDHSPHNVPHVGCTFYVDFFGFDSNQSLTTTFVGQAPTGKDVALPSGDWTGQMPANNAGGAGNDFDWEQPFTLDTSVLGAPQAQQGYHVKLTVSTGEPGGVKHKVFWVAPCQSTTTSSPTTATPTATTPTAPTTVSGTGTTTQSGGTAGGSAGGATVLGTTLHRGAKAAIPTQVLGLTLHRGATSSASAGAGALGSLPFTGAEVAGLLAAGAAAVGGGAALTVAGRRRRRATR